MEIYQESYIKQLEEQRNIINFTAWLQGQYNMSAVGAVLSKKTRYPKEPYDIQGEKKQLSDTERFKLWIAEFNKRFD